MIESLTSTISEIGSKFAETAKSAFDPDARVEKSSASEPKGLSDSKESKSYDPDAKVEKNEASKSGTDGEKPYDPDAKVEREGLTQEEKDKIKEETGWSDEIINHIDSMEQYEIYKNANFHEAEIDGKKCLVKDIDMDYVDPKTGMTNRERMAAGRSPIDSKTGEKIELHHMGQDKNGPFAELCENSEHGDGNHATLHPKTEASWRNEDGANQKYDKERAEHWKARAQEV